MYSYSYLINGTIPETRAKDRTEKIFRIGPKKVVQMTHNCRGRDSNPGHMAAYGLGNRLYSTLAASG
jgi:hypothetical protein